MVRVFLCGAFTRGHLRVENGELDHHSENKSAFDSQSLQNKTIQWKSNSVNTDMNNECKSKLCFINFFLNWSS